MGAASVSGDVGIHIRELRPAELEDAAALLAEGMLENPTHVAVFGAHPVRRRQRLLRFLRGIVHYVDGHGSLIGAFADDELVGTLGVILPHGCRPPLVEGIGTAAAMAFNPPVVVLRTAVWLTAWRRRDPREPHWHLGPMAVRAAFRRRGIARAMMTRVCERIDQSGGAAWLETDLSQNAAFYERMGFMTMHTGPVLGVTNWFMQRPPDTTRREPRAGPGAAMGGSATMWR